jgi:AraC family transcriptional regulator of adaptative response/methylated-DNA-[protein]-cysteine methyltransferase
VEKNKHYHTIAKAISFLETNFTNQPSLDMIANHVNLSPHHFQKVFTEWAGVSPKKFLQFITVQHAKSLLKNTPATLFDTTYDLGLSSTSRLHDLFIKIEGMTPKEFKNKGANLKINYNYKPSIFGKLLVASTAKGICYMGFSDDTNDAFSELRNRFENAVFTEQSDVFQKSAMEVFNNDWDKISEVKLHLKGTDFQLNVWEALLKIPSGKLSTYGELAKSINKPKAARAVGTAIGSNPIAFLIPCHRVIQASGLTGGYMWNPTRKKAIIGWEAAQTTVQ